MCCTKSWKSAGIFGLLICLGSCFAVQGFSESDKIQTKSEIPLGLKAVEHPKDNPPTAEKISLGKQLFFDPRLSKDNTISCSSCHDPNKGWSNGERFATGVGGKKGGRSSPTLINVAYNKSQFWDGRSPSLEAQAKGPIENSIEMNISGEEVVKKLNAIEGYRSQFQKAFGTDVTFDNVAKAIAAYERTILSGNAPYDRFKAGDKNALSETAQRGMKLFFGKANCTACHAGYNFSDGGYHNLGVGIKAKKVDIGRIAVSKLTQDRGSFKTPTLREIAKSAPYMHDGSVKTLEEVIDRYNKGGTPNNQLDEEIYELRLSDQEKKDLIKFLVEGLNSSDYPLHKPPELPKS